MNLDLILTKVRACGGRISPVRKAIIHSLLTKDCLVSHANIVTQLKKHHLTPDRSTIFRELRFLTAHNIICKSTIADVDYYEIPHDHHHHLICLHCDKITKVVMKDHIKCTSAHIARKNHFTITGHSLEFYGYCAQCRA
ncbi:MAG: transcriptional repressor [Parcubacteria group bacterium]|jgi:Fe2+ or Zn2+ uptake regulation protein